jgi:uncharacterized membrane protein (DUF106 family)
MKSLSLKNSSLRKAFNFSDCFDPKATIGSLLYSRCLLYIVLFISLINLFYIIHLRHVYSLVTFFLVGFISSFFVKNMIIILLFATIISLFFQSTQYRISESFVEGFEEDNKKDKEEQEDMSEDNNGDENDMSKKDSKKKDKKEGYKYSFQGEEPDISNKDEDEDKGEADLGNESETPSVSKTSKLKKDMEQYFEIQKELLTVLEKAEPLQKKAEAFKERFNTKK